MNLKRSLGFLIMLLGIGLLLYQDVSLTGAAIGVASNPKSDIATIFSFILVITGAIFFFNSYNSK